MTYYPQISTSPNCAYLPRQAHSYHAKEPPPSPQSTYADVPLVSKHPGSLSRSNKISPHLFPLISKFEALDALSHETRMPALRPPTLQTPRNSLPRRGELHGPVWTNLEEIFSPRRKPQQRYGDEYWENIVGSPPEGRLMSDLFKRSGSRRLGQIQPAIKVNSINLLGGMPQSNLSNPRKKDIWTRNPSDVRVERDIGLETRNSSVVKERVKFFDGCVDSAHGSPATATNSRANFSFLQNIAPNTPPHYKSLRDRHIVATAPSTVSKAGESTLKTTSINSATPQTPTRCIPAHNTKSGQAFEETPNPFLQTPHSHPPSRVMSPMTASTSQKIDKDHHVDCPLYENSKVLNPVQKGHSLEDTNCRRRLQEESLPRPGNFLSKGGRIIDKSKTIHQPQVLAKAANLTAGQKLSNHSDMKMLRERSVVARSFESGLWSVTKASDTKISKPRWKDFSHAIPSIPLVRAPHLRCSFAPRTQLQSDMPNLDERSTTIKAGGFPSKIPRVSGKRIPGLVQPTQICSSVPPKAVCRSHRDKINRWEREKEIGGRIEEDPAEDFSSRPLGKFIAARRSIFEHPWNEEVGKELEKRGLDWQEVQAVMNEFQDIEGQVGNDKITGTWKMVVASRLGTDELAAQDEGETDDAIGDVDMRIIVREARCGLAEPKPLRLLEMKRMILLCRELDSGSTRPGCEDWGSRAYFMKG